MTRTQKDIVSYFPHDANAAEGDTLTVLQSRFGNDGYAFWFKLLEKLASTEGHCLDCRNPIKWQLLLAKTGVNNITGVDMMNLLVEMQAIDGDLWQSKLIWCQKLVDNIADVYKNRRRELPLKPIIMDSNPLITPKKAITTPSNPQSKVNNIYKEIYKEKISDKKNSGENNQAIPPGVDPDEIPFGGDGLITSDSGYKESAAAAKTSPRKNKVNTYTSEMPEMQLALLLRDMILRNDDKAKVPQNGDIQKWCLKINELIRIDGRTPDSIEMVIKFSQTDSFWKANIQSPTKLREKFSQLFIKARGGNNNGTIRQSIPGNRPAGAFKDLD